MLLFKNRHSNVITYNRPERIRQTLLPQMSWMATRAMITSWMMTLLTPDELDDDFVTPDGWDDEFVTPDGWDGNDPQAG